MELDNDESEQSQQLLRVLAQIGSAAFAPATPVLNLLNSLGGALLGANGDDVELRYQLEFDPTYSGITRKDEKEIRFPPDVSRAPLREGYYAVVRMENRDQLPDFKSMTIKAPPYGPLLADSEEKLYTGGTWLLIRVSREDHAQALPQDLSTKLADILEPAAKTDTTSTAQIQAMVDALQGLRKNEQVKQKK